MPAKDPRSDLEWFIYDVAGETWESVGRELGVDGTTVMRWARNDASARNLLDLIAWAKRVCKHKRAPWPFWRRRLFPGLS